MSKNLFLDCFADELCKMAGAPGLLGRAAGKLKGLSPAKKVIGAVAGAGGIYEAGAHHGVKKEEGVAIDATQKAYKMGVERGALAFRDAIMRQMGGQHGEAE